MLNERKIPASLIHLLVTMLIAALAAALVFWKWYPSPFDEFAGGLQLFWLIVGVDVVCGPLLTWILIRKEKTRLALTVDICMIAALQLGALAYGLHSLSQARPLALVYEVDRFRVISYADLPEDELNALPGWVRPWRFGEIRTMGLRSTTTLDEKLESVNASLQGVEPSQRPSWWQDYALSVPQVLARAKPLSELRQKHPARQEILDTALRKADAVSLPGETSDPKDLRWLPLVGRRSMGWVALIDPVSARIRGYAALDGFD